MRSYKYILRSLIDDDWIAHLRNEECEPSNDECMPFGDIEGSHWHCRAWREHEEAALRARIGEEEYQRRIRRWAQ